MKTAESHQRLHEHPTLLPLHREKITLEQYKNSLKAFYGFYSPLEKFLNETSNDGLADYRNKAFFKNLQEDLHFHKINSSDLPICSFTFSEFDLTRAIGYLYLREGSALGGQVISKHLERELFLMPGIENKYFYNYGKNSFKNWQNFIQYLEKAEVQKTININETALFSKNLFQKLNDWLNKHV